MSNTSLRGTAVEKSNLKCKDPDLYKYFENVWMVRDRHINLKLPENYVFMLNLCHHPGRIHPLCGKESICSTWFDNGPQLGYVPIPIPDPKRPGHYLKPQDNVKHVEEHGDSDCMFKPPSYVIKEVFYNILKSNKEITDDFIQDVAKRTLLPVDEVKMHVQHLKLTAQRRKEGAKKAAVTRAKNKKKDDSEEVWCWCIKCEERNCSVKWFHLRCIGLTLFPPCIWFCPDCLPADAEKYCICRQEEYGLMLGCDNKDCEITWYHLPCIQGSDPEPPEGEWYCPQCAKRKFVEEV